MAMLRRAVRVARRLFAHEGRVRGCMPGT